MLTSGADGLHCFPSLSLSARRFGTSADYKTFKANGNKLPESLGRQIAARAGESSAKSKAK